MKCAREPFGGLRILNTVDEHGNQDTRDLFEFAQFSLPVKPPTIHIPRSNIGVSWSFSPTPSRT